MKGIESVKALLLAGTIRVIVFDLDGTLYSSRAGMEFQIIPNMQRHTAAMLGISIDDARRLLGKYRREFRSSVLGLQQYHGVDPLDFYDRVYGDIDRSAIKKHDNLECRLERLALLCPLALLTNSNRLHALEALELLGLTRYFTHIISVENAGFIRKPNLEAFQGLLKCLDVDARSVLVFDDSYPNLETAHSLGMYTALVSNGIADPPLFWEMHKRETHEAPDFVDLCNHDIVELLTALCED